MMIQNLKKDITRKNKKKIPFGIIHAQTTFNNTIITITDFYGNTISSASAGSVGFKGARKSTSFAAQLIVEKALNEAKEFGLKRVEIFLKGQGIGREIVIKSVQNFGLHILAIKDITTIPHNGCRPPKNRRI